ncbi:MAG TPA: Asp-tRNA(Asn)/Glu-tRNA(Gln) amidotransferase GatCAB subunit B [Ruminococcaceae bacterium]|nr:Asp-tRNA(Asn)/Glu-tRNA(Gln) amidotransferase GatCAB subunit B [Oscillospiraceae bacterium]
MLYTPVIGLEIHAELLTNSKVFCTCSAEFGGEQNSRCCPVCSGLPGTLPVINQKAVEYAVKAGFALNCDINRYSRFDRKNYFYPDLPKAYQISQLDLPLCINGSVKIQAEDGEKNIRINRIHLEEDAGKLVHDEFDDVSLADYNRCGVPLIEIVTEPDITSAQQAKSFVEQVSLLLQYAGVCDCKMEQGSMRCDVNISLKRADEQKLGTRAEIKNLNSLKSIVRAIEYEISRQQEILQDGGRVIQETRRFVDSLGETRSMRSKEDAQDYRYFPEPDIMPVIFAEDDLEQIKSSMPVMPDLRLDKYISQYKLSPSDAAVIVSQKQVSDFFEQSLKAYDNPKSISSFILVELLRTLNEKGQQLSELNICPEDFAELVKLADDEKISKNNAKTVFRLMLQTSEKPRDIIERNSFWIVEDNAASAAAVKEVISENGDAVAKYLAGEAKLFGFLMGQCAAKLKGAANPKAVKELLQAQLDILKNAGS